MCASDPLPREHRASNTANLQLHQFSNAFPTLGKRKAMHLFLQTRNNNAYAPWNHHARREGDEQPLHFHHCTTTAAFTHLLYSSKTCTVAATPPEKKKYHVTASLLHVSSCHFIVKVVKAGQIFKSGQRLVKQERLKCKYWYFWMSLQIWTTRLKLAYGEN